MLNRDIEQSYKRRREGSKANLDIFGHDRARMQTHTPHQAGLDGGLDPSLTVAVHEVSPIITWPWSSTFSPGQSLCFV
jgi:hypothetical protein